MSQSTGMPCPRCAAPIRATADDLLVRGHLVCSACGLLLTVDRRASAQSLELLRKVDAAAKGVAAATKPML